MDFEEIWSDHKGFIIAVGVTLIALLIFLGVKSAMFSDPTNRAVVAARGAQSTLMRETRVTGGDLDQLRDEAGELEKRLGELKERVEIEIPTAFVLPEANAKSTYAKVLQDTRDKVADVAGIKNVRVPYELGVPNITPNTRDEMERFLRGLYVVERMVSYGIDAGVSRFESLEVKPGRGGSFLRETRVQVRVLTDGPALARLMDRALDPADPLVVTEFKVSRPARGEGVIATIGVSILAVDLEKPIEEEVTS